MAESWIYNITTGNRIGTNNSIYHKFSFFISSLLMTIWLFFFNFVFLIYFKLTATSNSHSTKIMGIHSPSFRLTLASVWCPGNRIMCKSNIREAPLILCYQSLLVKMKADSRGYDLFRTCDTIIFMSQDSLARLGPMLQVQFPITVILSTNSLILLRYRLSKAESF